ncbi:MAG: hypothetical protein MUO34_14795 [Ignavibacteriaceae bacterium]|nr:hypothetical protein [Ignavibacteriaceae bacterium]
MLKQLVMVLTLAAFFGAFALAQEKPETEKKEKQECSMSCCANKEMHSDMKMDGSKESHKQMEHKKSDNNMHGMKHDMKSDSMDDNSMVREGEIDLKAIDENGDGKVYQDQMCWNVLSDSEGECPLCGMTLKEVSLDKAKENLKKHDHKVKE